VDTIVVDKTGTLTAGKPAVTGVEAAGKSSEAEVLRVAAALEAGSEHPLAAAILAEAKARSISETTATDFNAVPGKGVRAMVDGRRVSLGNSALMAEDRVEIASFAASASARR